MWPFTKPKEEIYEQRVYDAYYSETCPICKNIVVDSIHKVELLGFDKVPYFNQRIVTECTNCHVAVFTDRKGMVVTLQKYRQEHEGLFGLIKISEEVIK